MSLSVETVSLIRIARTVCLMVLFVVNVFEDMRARLAFLHSEPWRF